MRTHKRLIDIIDPTPDVMDALMKLSFPRAWTWRSSNNSLLPGLKRPSKEKAETPDRQRRPAKAAADAFNARSRE